MSHKPKLLVSSVAVVGSLVALAAIYAGREVLLFHWRFRQLATWEGGSYVPRVLEGDELPQDVLGHQEWIVNHPDVAIPRLHGALNSPEVPRKLAALDLIQRMEKPATASSRLQPFWQAFENRDAVERYSRDPGLLLVSSTVGGVHGGNWNVLLVELSGETARLWRAEGVAFPDRPRIVIRSVTLRGDARRDYLRALARQLLREKIPGIEDEPTSTGVLRCDFYTPKGTPADSIFELRMVTQLRAWGWLDDVATEAMELATRPDDTEAQPFETADAVQFLLTVLRRAPGLLDDAVAWAFCDLKLEDALQRRVIEQLSPDSSAPAVKAALDAIANTQPVK